MHFEPIELAKRPFKSDRFRSFQKYSRRPCTLLASEQILLSRNLGRVPSGS
jgi:hypothetical protein